MTHPDDHQTAVNALAMPDPFRGRAVPEETTACRRFYRGCNCKGCRRAERECPSSWPKVGEAR